MIERTATPFGALGDDAALDAWFGARSPLYGRALDRADPPTEGYR
ncbi:hypothetical protein [Kribbella sp. NPDC003557]|jgi:hypothetical protein